jgi:hypothetical protein
MSMPETKSQLAKDFGVFLQPGFWVAVVLNLLLAGAVAGALIYGNMQYGISPL